MTVETAKLVARVDPERVNRILEDLVRFPSVNPPGGEDGIARYIADRLEKAGLTAEVKDVSPGRPNAVVRLDMDRPGPTLVMNSHMDVVPPGNNWETDPFTPVRKDGRIYGRGTVDAKGPLAGMIAALEVLAGFRSQLRGSIVLQAVMDEESGSAGTRALIPGLKADMAIVGEPTACRLCTAHKGTSRSAIVVKGKSAHAAEPEAGINAIEGAARVIEALRAYHAELRRRSHPLVGSPSAVVTVIQGGTKGNMVPDRCEITLSRRMIPGESEQVVAQELEAIFGELRRSTPPVDVSIGQFFQTSGGPSETPESDAFVRLARRAVTDLLGRDPGLHGFGPNCDMAQLRGVAGVPAFVLGPGETALSHQANEYVPIAELELVTRMYTCIAASALA